MSLSKVTYTNNSTQINAGNLNDIQDAIIALEGQFKTGSIAGSGGTVSISMTRGIVFMTRGSNATVALVDQWSGVANIATTANFVVSNSSNTVTLTNNSANNCDYGVIAF